MAILQIENSSVIRTVPWNFSSGYLLFASHKKNENREKQVEMKAAYSGIREGLDDGVIGRGRGCWKAKAKIIVGPMEIGTVQAVEGVDGRRGIGRRERHQLTVCFHRKWWALQKWMESGSPETWFSWKGICLLHGSLSLECETGQAKVASTFTATVTVKSSPVEAMRVRRPESWTWSPLWDGGTSPSSRQTNKQSPNTSSDDKPDGYRHSEGDDEILPKLFWPWTP